MTAQALADAIGRFIQEHSSDRSVMPAISDLKAAQSALGRIGNVKDTSKPSPGKQAANRSGGGKMPAALQKMMQGAQGG